MPSHSASQKSRHFLTADDFPKSKHFSIISYESPDSEGPFFFGHISQLNVKDRHGFVTFDEQRVISSKKANAQLVQIPFRLDDIIKYENETLQSPRVDDLVMFSVIEEHNMRTAYNVRVFPPDVHHQMRSFFRCQQDVNLIRRKIDKLENQYQAKMPSLEKQASTIFNEFHGPVITKIERVEETLHADKDDADLILQTTSGKTEYLVGDEDDLEKVENMIATMVVGSKLPKSVHIKETKSKQTISTTTTSTPSERKSTREERKKKETPRKKRNHVDKVYAPIVEVQPTLQFTAAISQIKVALENREYAEAVALLVDNVRIRDVDPDFIFTNFSPLFAAVVENKIEPALIFNLLRYLFASMSSASTRSEANRFHDVLVEIILYCTRFLYTREYRVRTRIVAKAITEMPNTNAGGYAQHALYLLTANYRSLNYEALRRIERFLSAVSVSLPMHSHFLVRQYEHVKNRVEDMEQQWYQHNAERSFKHPVPIPTDVMRFDTSADLLPESEDKKKSLSELFLDVSFNKETLSNDILELISILEPTKEEIIAKKEAVQDMQEVVKKTLGQSAHLHMYGSSASGFGMRKCDVDLCLTVNDSTKDQNDNKVQSNFLHELQSRLERKARHEKHLRLKQSVSKSRVPILKLENTVGHVEMDICMGTLLGVANTKLLRKYAKIHPKVRELIYIVKHWAKTRKINDAASGSLSSYSYVLLTIAYLQELGVLPSLQALVSHPHCEVDCQFFVNIPKLYTLWEPKADISSFTIAELFYGFFKYHCRVFNKAQWVSSIKHAAPLKKVWSSPLSIEDPFELRDLGTVITDQKAPLIEKEFERALKLLSEGQSLGEVIKPPLHEVDDTNIYAQKRPNYEAHADVKRVKILLSEGHVFQGQLRVNAKRFFEAYVTVEGFSKDIYIDGLNARNRALHGDLVAIKVHSKEEEDNSEQHSGEVLSIIQRKAPLLYACTLMKQSRPGHCHWLLPLEKTYPKIMVEYDDFTNKYNVKGDDLQDYIFVVRLDPTWKTNSRFPKGNIVGTLGLRRDLWAQKRAIFLQQMPQLYEKLYGKTDQMDDAEEHKNNVVIHTTPLEVEHDTSMDHLYQDWTDRRIFTIDPTQSRDLDDALSIETLPNGKYKIGVYIADVTRFLTEGNEHDTDARERCTSVYMIDMVEHMLNPQLSQDQASILPNVPRYAVAVEWVMNENGKVDFGTVEFSKGRMASCCRLDYDTVQDIIEGADKDITVSAPHTKECIVNDVHVMNKIAQNLKERRRNSGAVSLGSSDLDFKLDESGYPIGVNRPEHNESHQLIEEFMLKANQLTAITLHNEFGDEAVQRRHESPDEAGLMKTVLQYGRALNRLIAQSPLPNQADLMFGTQDIERALVRIQNGDQNNLSSLTAMNNLIAATERFKDIESCVRHIMLREMNIGKYAREGDCKKEEDTGVHHFALNMEYYTHFTSPIRRYADVLVHRQIMELIKAKHEKRPVQAPLAGNELSNMIEKINDQSVRAKNIQEHLNRLYLTHLVAKQIREGQLIRKKAVIMSLGRRSFTAFIEEYGAEIQCSLMKDLKNTPSFVSNGDVEPDEIVDLSGEVEFVNLLWTDPQDERTTRKDMQLYAFKTLYVDLWADFETIPATLRIYDIWDYNVGDDGAPPPQELTLRSSPVLSHTSHNEKHNRYDRAPKREKSSMHATTQREPRRGDRRRGHNDGDDKSSSRDHSPKARRFEGSHSNKNKNKNRDNNGRGRARGNFAPRSNLGADFASAFMSVNQSSHTSGENSLSRHDSGSDAGPQTRSYRSNGYKRRRGGGRGNSGGGGRGRGGSRSSWQ
eukprot:CAMPEP_0117456698 /NCGR_PEP_ID=MMETSP0759-20121206/12011_1 /TAXON_ID=63605 /ORGANISM="Percolomonas cosmopolitus, Strain WS" /LENGTH=1806 /DNA_ID=CAMNT_0005250045 /DNA_START=283 /DNA_END=5703 /DNA_ORIENTATION=-